MYYLYNTRISALFYFLFFICIESNTVNKEIIEYHNPANCRKNLIFNVTTLSCVECDSTKNLKPSENNLYCICNEYSKIVAIKHGVPICEPCENNSISTINGQNCITCRNDSIDDKCACRPNEIKIERNIDGQLLKVLKCASCPHNTYPTLDKSQCLSCHNLQSNNQRNDAFLNLTRIKIEQCLQRNSTDILNSSDSYVVNFENESIDSYYFRINLQLALYACENGNEVECKHLSNMCTLTLFKNHSNPCKLFLEHPNPPSWLFYKRNETLKILNSNNISQKYSLKNSNSNSRLNITVIRYKLNGEFHSFDKPNLFCSILDNIRFGVNMKKNCSFTAKELQKKNTEFLSPYLTYREQEKLFLYALPVLVKNSNVMDDITQWQLVRQFFIVDTSSGFRTILNNNSFTKGTNLSIFRYMKSIEVLIKIQDEKSRSKICPPLFVIEYGEVTEEEIIKNKQLTVEYKVTFIIKDNSIPEAMEISIGVFSSFAIMYSILQTWSHCRRNWDNRFHPMMIFWFLIYSFGAVGNALILVTIFTCIYIFVFYKGQTVFHIQLPDSNIENNMKMYTVIAFAFKIIEMISFIHQHRNVNVFFVDWEQPKTIHTRYLKDTYIAPLRKTRVRKRKIPSTSTTVVKKKRKKHLSSSSSHARFSNCRENLSIVYKPWENYDNNSIVQYEAHEFPVSIWRTYFVVNEWFELQTARKISILFQIIIILLILEVIGLKYYALAVPELKLETDKNVEYSYTLFYALGALVYIFLYGFQWFVSIMFYEKFVKNKIQHFIDLCSIANISVFILEFDYFGFYIHGRSVHGFADTDLATLTNDLQKEENNLCAHRGLVPGMTDQTFIMSMSPSFRYFYDKLLNLNNTIDTFWRGNILGFLTWQRNLQSHSRVKKFLTGFLDHCFHDLDYIIKDRLFFEKLLDIEFIHSTDKTIFYIDKDHSFDRMLFYGNEWTLGTFEITLFAFVQTFSKDYIIACLTTLLVSQLLIMICKCNGKKNLAQKTLIDDRFLILQLQLIANQ